MTTLPEPALWVAVMAVILLGGTVKGALGIGLPAVSMSLLPLLIDPALAVTLLTVPIVVTNAQQFLTAPDRRGIARDFRVAAIALFATILAVSLRLDDAPDRLIAVVVGVSLSTFAITALMRVRFPVGMGAGWQAAAGILAGITGGLSAVKTPVMMYCVALDLPRDRLVGAMGFLFLVGGLGLAGGLVSGGLLDSVTLPLSALAVTMAMAGFQAGARLRRRINAALFRRLLLGAMLVLGLRLVAVNLA